MALTLGQRLPPRLLKLMLIAIPLVALLGVGFAYVMFHLVSPPPGKPLAVLDIKSGAPFVLRFVANGEPPRAFLDMQCESCSFPVTGELTLRADGRELERARIMTGDSRDRAWGGHDRYLEQQLIFGAPEQPAGTRLELSGKLVVGRARGGLANRELKDAPPPRIKLLRVTVAP